MRTASVVILTCIAVTVLVAVAAAQTAEAPTRVPAQGEAPIVKSPQDGDLVGPSTLVVGVAPLGSLVVIQTQIYDTLDDAKYYRMIPGHRHKVNPDGTFALLISTPRAFFWEQRPLRYEIHTYTITADGEQSPHTITLVKPKPPTP